MQNGNANDSSHENSLQQNSFQNTRPKLSMRQKALVMAPLFLVLIIDTMGFGLVFPILGPLFLSKHSQMVSPDMSFAIREVLYGVTLGAFSIAMFFGAPFMGDLSDRVGRKRAMLICLFTMAIGYFISGIGIEFNAFILLLLGRFVAGFAAGNQSIAQAAIIDISHQDEKADNLSVITVANTVGFIIGPIVGGYLSDPSILAWFNFALPFFIAGGLGAINGVILIFTLKETYVERAKTKLNLLKGVTVFIEAFRDVRVRSLSLALLFIETGWVLYFFYISFYLVAVFHYTNRDIGDFMAYLGVIWGISLALIMRIMSRFWSLKTIVFVSCALSVVGIVLHFIHDIRAVWIGVVPLGMGAALVYIAMMAIFSHAVEDHEQGKVMGIAGAVVAAGWGVGSVLASFTAEINVYLPFLIAAVFTVIGAALMVSYKK